MIKEATANARAAADQFARDSGSRPGGIRQANQGGRLIGKGAKQHFKLDSGINCQKQYPRIFYPGRKRQAFGMASRSPPCKPSSDVLTRFRSLD
jgi:hypothetical protein